jgi:type I restriction enzyme R subunit
MLGGSLRILVNGLPLVHVELKRRGVPIREAFNQINRYQRDSFWAGTGLYQYVQLFVISNGTQTKYYSNTTRDRHIDESAKARGVVVGWGKQSSHSFEFTSWWAAENNQPIEDLVGFTKTFFAKHTILNILTKYCVFDTDRTLLVMRPYQIAATEKILQRIVTGTNAKQLGKVEAGGYVWHTTGSGKTLTSFKTAQLASRMPEVDKVLFVVDRKDLDYQIIDREALMPGETREFMAAAFRDGAVQSTGTAISRILPPMSRFGAGAADRFAAKRTAVLDTLTAYFDRFFGLG